MNGIELTFVDVIVTTVVCCLIAYQIYDDNRRRKAIKKYYSSSIVGLFCVIRRLCKDESRIDALTDELRELKSTIQALENASRRNKISLTNLEIGTQKRIKKLARAKAIGKRRRRKA